MSNKEAIANLVALMTSFRLEIKELPDDLKCAKCKSVLKNACQMPCGCRFCRTCIDDMISRGSQFCPGSSQECGDTSLTTALLDYRANNSILKLTAKCPHTNCSREYQLADMEGHMRVCSRKNNDCPFRELGCAQSALSGEEMGGHLVQESRGHCEILIGTVANINRDMEILRRELLLKDEQARHLENEMKLIKDENKSIKDEYKSIKNEYRSIKTEYKSMKNENKTINDANKSIKIDIKSIKDENKLIKIENESIKREKEMLCDLVRQLSEKLEQEIDEKHQSDERYSAMITAVTGAVASNRDEMEPIREFIRSIIVQFARMKCQMQSIQVAAGMGQLDDWLNEEDVGKSEWGWYSVSKYSGKFGFAYAFELQSDNSVSMEGELWIYLIIWDGPCAYLLEWPFRGDVTVTVADRDRREACSILTLQCEINRPANNKCNGSKPFKFPHAALRGAGVNLERGMRISCRIVPCAGQ